MQNSVNIQSLSYRRGSRVIFNNVDLQIAQGKITAVMGPSGAGKTTLLKIIGGQLHPQQGQVTVLGKNIHTLSSRKLYALRRNLGLLFQTGALFTNLSVYDNVAFPLREHTALSETMIRDIVLMKLQAVGLRGAQNLMPAQLSGGMARRVALARAIALDPEIIMFDEPFTGQDPIGKGVLVKLIKTVNQSLGMTTILVSHDVEETLILADYVYVISEGEVIGHGSADEIRHTADPRVKQFIQGLPDGIVPFHYPAKPYQDDLLAIGAQ